MPQERIRRRIWREVFPEEASVDTETFDYEYLGLLSLTPAVIRKVAKYAAYIAATETHDAHPLEESAADLDDVTITFDHVVLGLQYAEEAGGVAIESEFFQYEDKLRSYENQAVGRDVETLFKLKYGVEDGDADADADPAGASEPGADPVSAETEEPEVPKEENEEPADTPASATKGGDDTADDARTVDTGPDGGTADDPTTDASGGETSPSNTVPEDEPTSDAALEDDDGGTDTPDTEAADGTADGESGSHSSMAPDALDPEVVVEQFYDGIDTKDLEAVQALYHSSSAVDELSRQEMMAMHLNDTSMVTSPRRTAEQADRVVLEFEEESSSHRIPMAFELRLDDGKWRIYSIEHGEPVTKDDAA
ncbi:AAA family ATPase [Halobiforma nitratireducens JCM 10879]|uniref:AAA family ATPase n=1 Tax=Halobiforma nitratireducens JCM 10879 TaxID=1227454 RepID=M0LLX7_9EURY|nr:AAA family ATPase [Halobiforma nitratireducens JCM 10879]